MFFRQRHLNRDKLTDSRVTRRNIVAFYMKELTQSDLISLFLPVPSSPRSATREVGDTTDSWAKLKLF